MSFGSKALAWYFVWAAVILYGGLQPVFGTDLKVLPGHVPEALSSLAPIGRLAATNELWLAIGLPLRDRAGLENFVAQVSDPASPNFRHYLTREELTARFGPTEQDYEAVKNFARTNGLAIAVTHDNRLLLDVTGPVAAVEKAFHITLRTYRHPTEARDFFAPDTEPMVDAALPVVDIEGLSDFSLPHSKWGKSKMRPSHSKKNRQRQCSRRLW
jgi:subtilase family serine protease